MTVVKTLTLSDWWFVFFVCERSTNCAQLSVAFLLVLSGEERGLCARMNFLWLHLPWVAFKATQLLKRAEEVKWPDS